MTERKPRRRRGNSAEAQRAYRDRERELGRPTSDMVAMSVFRFLVGELAIARKEGPLAQIEERVIADFLHRYPNLTKSGIQQRYENMLDDIERLHRQGLLRPKS